jgi:hypothetical protein
VEFAQCRRWASARGTLNRPTWAITYLLRPPDLNRLLKNYKKVTRVDTEVKPIETPTAILDALGDDLGAKEGVDIDLANILKSHILKAAPAHNAVFQAKDAIPKLAGKRADSTKSEASNG